MTTVAMTDCAGLWRRTLLIGPDGTRDDTPGVLWLQGPTGYVDSRGFAGRLHQNGEVFEWHRAVDVGCVQQSGVRVGPDQRYRRVVAD